MFAAACSVCAADIPGATIAPALATQLAAALQDKGPAYKPRTEHLNADGSPRYSNRLLLEDSPYLLQHAHNPVNWFPWGPEAFAQAQAQDKPIFLSIGYSTCHWCHVMEKESFDNIETATLINQNFIAIKVDREQRPDIDLTYMTAIRLLTQRGGWPMSSFLNVDGKTFWGGTYFKPSVFKPLLGEITELWSKQRPEIEARAEQIAKAVNDVTRNIRAVQALDQAVIESAVTALRKRRDQQRGGIGPAPKFPQESTYLFLLDQALRYGDAELAAWLKFDLDAIANGGIHDHIGGGFHRYSTDAEWRIPHFEKMLYNQAQLLRVYSHAYQLFADPRYARIVAGIVAFVERDLLSPHGGYYSAIDADSPGGEGSFYVWRRAELDALLDPQLAASAADWYTVDAAGNFEGANVLHLTRTAEAFAATNKLTVEQWYADVDDIRATLLLARAKRAQPLRDEKIVTSWNALLITALAEASVIFNRPDYLERATACAEFLLAHHYGNAGVLWRTTYRGPGGVRAIAADYAALSEAFIALYDASSEPRWLEHAKALLDALREDYWDADRGGYFMSAAADQGVAMARPKSLEDNAVASGNATALSALAGLNERVADLAVEAQAREQLLAITGDLEEAPTAHTYALRAHEIFRHGGSGPVRYAARGALRIVTNVVESKLAVAITIKDGWHINAHEHGFEDLVGSTLSVAAGEAGWELAGIKYPQPIKKSLSFHGSELALYEGQVRIEAQLAPLKQTAGLLRLHLTLQACNDRECLPPEQVALNTYVTGRQDSAGR